jgi:hypothetical protein
MGGDASRGQPGTCAGVWQYRATTRKKKDGSAALVRAAARIAWEVCDSELTASLTEIRLIQTLRPRRNVASAFPFLYPFIGLHADGHETYFCLTASPGAFAAFDFHGAFRSRDVTGDAFFALARLLRFVGHPVPRHHCRRLGSAAHSSVTIPRLHASPRGGGACSREYREPLEALALELLEHPGARAKRAEIHADIQAVAHFFESEARALARARAITGYATYPVPQQDRDLIFVESRRAEPIRA